MADQHKITALAKACGAKPLLHFADSEPCMQMPNGNIIHPLIDHNCAMAVMERLCGD